MGRLHSQDRLSTRRCSGTGRATARLLRPLPSIRPCLSPDLRTRPDTQPLDPWESAPDTRAMTDFERNLRRVTEHVMIDLDFGADNVRYSPRAARQWRQWTGRLSGATLAHRSAPAEALLVWVSRTFTPATADVFTLRRAYPGLVATWVEGSTAIAYTRFGLVTRFVAPNSSLHCRAIESELAGQRCPAVDIVSRSSGRRFVLAARSAEQSVQVYESNAVRHMRRMTSIINSFT